MNNERCKRYFIPPVLMKYGWGPFALIALGISPFIMGWNIPDPFGLLAIGAIVAGVMWQSAVTNANANRKKDVPTDAEYAKAVQTKFLNLNLMQKALEKVGIDEDQLQEIPPVSFHGYRVDGESLLKIGEDGKLRTSKYDATVLFFSDAQLYMYQHIFDMVEGIAEEITREFFYKDVVSCYTSSKKSEKNPDKKGVNTFHLKVSGDEFRCSIDGVAQDGISVESVINAMKQKLREKKR